MEFDKKTVALLAVVATIAIAALVYFVVLVGNTGPTNSFTGYTQVSGGTCVAEEWAANYTGSVGQLLVNLYGTSPGVVTTSLQMAIYNSAGVLLTYGQPPSGENIAFAGGGYTGYYVTTGSNPTITQGDQYWIVSVASASGGYETQTSSNIGYEIPCGDAIPSSLSVPPSGTSLGAEAQMYAVSVATASSTTTASSSSSPLSVSISASPSSGNAPLSTSFASIVSGGTAPYTYSWSFGDGTSSTSESPAHTYQNAGTYLAQLKVTDSTGATATASYSVAANDLSTSTTSYYTTTQTTVTTSTGVTTVTSGSSTFTSTYTTEYTTAQCLILNAVNGCHLPNTPPGLPIAWATSNMSVQATSVTGQIFLSSGLTVSEITSSNTISNVAYNSNAMQVEFTSSGHVSISMMVPQKPSSVWADSTQISTWNYANGVLTVSADPSTITAFFGSSSSNPVVTFIEANWILMIIIVAVAAGIIGASMRRR